MQNIFNKIVVIGDVHGRGCWMDIINKNEDADLFVFLGDYVSTHENISPRQQIANLLAILNLKEMMPERVILLRGNHDMQHLGYDWAECSGFFREVEKEMSKPEARDRYLRDTQWVYVYNDIIFSHAGITKRWFKDSGVEKVEDINTLPPSELFGFRPCKFSDYYGISETQGPTWIRPYTLIDYALPGYTQVVGHTPVKQICNLKDELEKHDPENYTGEEQNIWLCDRLPNEYLIIENGEFKPTKI